MKFMNHTNWILASFCSLLLESSSLAFGPPRPPIPPVSCRPSGEWVNSDLFVGKADVAWVGGGTANSRAIFVVGAGGDLPGDSMRRGWLVRRSTDRGRTWTTAEQYGLLL